MSKLFKDVKGTASELKDNSDYDKLVELVGESGARRSIQHKLNERGITEQDWTSYREVRSKLHANPLAVKEELKEISDLTDGILDS
ncbi:hypothetical protein BCS65_19345 [Vibrio cyclitrophicus]|uniref:hypothetical protein n=1 Tax=Vibrio cyclitrophicus TaxID=47951 RepID=UPI000C82B163|nr:hypothetical protein [Vibrio cyclitrophicus]PMJ54176.1 hypothetical protein BCU19_18535 [Vibrio cyclitrophicus]